MSVHLELSKFKSPHFTFFYKEWPIIILWFFSYNFGNNLIAYTLVGVCFKFKFFNIYLCLSFKGDILKIWEIIITVDGNMIWVNSFWLVSKICFLDLILIKTSVILFENFVTRLKLNLVLMIRFNFSIKILLRKI